MTNNDINFDVRSPRNDKKTAIKTPIIRIKELPIETLRHDKSMETNQRLAEAFIARFVVIKFGYVT